MLGTDTALTIPGATLESQPNIVLAASRFATLTGQTDCLPSYRAGSSRFLADLVSTSVPDFRIRQRVSDHLDACWAIVAVPDDVNRPPKPRGASRRFRPGCARPASRFPRCFGRERGGPDGGSYSCERSRGLCTASYETPDPELRLRVLGLLRTGGQALRSPISQWQELTSPWCVINSQATG